MRIIHFTYNTTGGAGKVAKQLHLLFRKNGIESALINLGEEDSGVHIYKIPALQTPVRRIKSKFQLLLFRVFARMRYPKKPQYAFHFNYNFRKLRISEIIAAIPFKPDVIFLHWIADFIMPEHIRQLKEHYNCKIVWRYNDLAAATGGCHYTNGCEKYKMGCGTCPALSSEKLDDWSRRFFKRKQEQLQDVPLVVVNSTKDTETVYKTSPLFANRKHEFIRNSLDEKIYMYGDKATARKLVGIDPDRKVIFWGATYIEEERKGFKYFVEGLQLLKKDYPNNDLIIVIAGNRSGTLGQDIPFEHRFVGLLTPQDLASWYRAADLIAVSSLEDGGPMMIVESLMCGRPVVSFATGLANELVTNSETGYRARKGDSKDLASGLLYIVNLQPAELQKLSDNCHQLAMKLYSEQTEIAAYRKLLSEL